MDTVERLLADELERLAAGPQPDPDRMLARISRRRRHNRTLVAALVLCLVGVTAVALRGYRTDPPPTADPKPPPYLTGRPWEYYFVGERTGYALAGNCPPGSSDCELWITSTVDGGGTWRWRRVPGRSYPRDDTTWLNLRAWGAGLVYLDDLVPSRPALFSADGGATWVERPSTPQGTVDEIPPGAPTTVEPGDEPQSIRISVLRPDGTAGWLTAAPPAHFSRYPTEPVTGQDGSVWVRGGDDTRPWLFVTRDRGRTWTEVPLPPDAYAETLASNGGFLETWDGRTVYLVDQWRYRVWRTTDDGQRWQEIEATPKPTVDVPMLPAATPDGGLMLNDSSGRQVYAVGPTGSRFEPQTGLPFTTVGRVGARLVGGGPDGITHTSADGRTWTELRY
jgi:hypothetical protein